MFPREVEHASESGNKRGRGVDEEVRGEVVRTECGVNASVEASVAHVRLREAVLQGRPFPLRLLIGGDSGQLLSHLLVERRHVALHFCIELLGSGWTSRAEQVAAKWSARLLRAAAWSAGLSPVRERTLTMGSEGDAAVARKARQNNLESRWSAARAHSHRHSSSAAARHTRPRFILAWTKAARVAADRRRRQTV